MEWLHQVAAEGLPMALALCLALPLSQAGAQASRVRDSCLHGPFSIIISCQLGQELPC